MEKKYLIEMLANLETMMASGAFNRKTLFVFGHCHSSEIMLDWLLSKGIAPAGILDNNQSKHGQEYRGIPVISPDTICREDNPDSVVLIAARACASMAAQLGRMRYRGEICNVVNYNTFSEYSLSEETFSRRKDRVMRGMASLSKIREEYSKQHLVICPKNALGDVFLALSYLPEYSRKNSISETTVVVVGNGCRQVAELFGVTNLVMFDEIIMDDVVQAILFTNDKNSVIAHHDHPYTDNIIKYLNKYFLSFNDYYKIAVYGLDQMSAPVQANGHRPFTDTHKIVKNRTVIISPYAKSVVQLPGVFWEDLAKRLHVDGFLVGTNVVGDEKPINGTMALRIPLNQIVSAVEFAGYFIGLRSGICDILSDAKCRKVVVFPQCIYSTTRFTVSEFFALPGWESYVFQGMASCYEIMSQL